MFSTSGNNDQDQKRNENNDRSDMADATSLILSSQYLDNTNRNYSYFNSADSINNRNSIYIQPEQMEAYSSTVHSGHEHLMILAAAAVNSSPPNDSYKSIGNLNEAVLNNSSESPHFSIHDPPLIRLSPTSPSYIFHHNRNNEDFQGITNEIHNQDYSPNNLEWLSQELYVKTENTPEDLTHSSLKRHSYNNSLSDAEFPSLQSRGLGHLRHTERRDYDYSQNTSTTNLFQRKELKRKRMYTSRNEYDTIMNRRLQTPNSVDDFTANLNTSTFINLTDSDGESQTEERITIRDRLTPELPRSNVQWWPIKRHCGGANNDNDNNIDGLDNNNGAINGHDLMTSSTEMTSPPLDDDCFITNHYSPQSPQLYSNSANVGDGPKDYRINESRNDEVLNSYDHLRRQNPSNNLPTRTDNPISDPRITSSNVSSYLRHVLVPQFCNRRPYTVSNLHTSFHDLSRLYLPQSSDRPCPYQTMSQSGILESGEFYPRRSSSDEFIPTNASDPDTHPSHTNPISPARSSLLNERVVNAPDSDLFNDIRYSRNTIHPTMNTFLRAYGLTERPLEERYQPLRDPRLYSDSMRIHPRVRISRNLINPMLENRSGSHYSRPFTMYESQGNVESVIQLALHLETSWCGISPEEFARLPCHYYGMDTGDSWNHSAVKQDKCMVCLDEFMTNDQLRTLSCGHQYHVVCVDKWLKMNRTCPMCRSDAVLGSSNYLFVN